LDRSKAHVFIFPAAGQEIFGSIQNICAKLTDRIETGEVQVAVRLIDVARVANVSRSTASNVYANPARVRPELRERVEEAAQSLGYAGPDPKGRILRAGKVNSIGVVVPGQWGVADALRSPVFVQFLQGVAQACDQAGANMVLLPDVPGTNGIAAALVDGFIFGRTEQLEQLEAAHRRRLPFAVVDFNAGPDVNAVLVDARAGAKAAVKHLVDLGHRRFGIMSFLRGSGPAQVFEAAANRDLSDVGIKVDQEKLAGATEALAAAGIDINGVPVVHAEPWDKAAARLLLDAAPNATAIFSLSAMQALSVINEARLRNIKVPKDLSVVGFNDIPEAILSHPPLTTVDSRSTEKGRIAAGFVLAGQHGQQHILLPKLIIRNSTAEAPAR
jgi:DNA-binding LacI/PurR family transcriptional regulator